MGGVPRQWPSTRSSTISWSFFQLTTRYGPVPEVASALRPKSRPNRFATVGLRMADEMWAMVGSKAPNWYLVTKRTVWSSTTSTRSSITNSGRRLCFCAGSSTLAKVARTASAVNGVPSWKVTPFRRLNVHVTPSGATDHVSASRPTIFIWSSKPSRPSKTMPITWSDSVSVVLCGSSVVASAGAAKISVSRAPPASRSDAPPQAAATASVTASANSRQGRRSHGVIHCVRPSSRLATPKAHPPGRTMWARQA